MSEAIVVRLPHRFWRFPCPSNNSALAGLVEVDLGEWDVGGVRRRLVLRVECDRLPALVDEVDVAPGREKRFGYGALHTFLAAVEGG